MARLKNQRERVCLVCDKLFWVVESHAKRGNCNYCSLICLHKSPYFAEKIRRAKVGGKATLQAKNNMRLAQLGRKHPQSVKDKIGNSQRGRKLSAKQVRLMSETRKGKSAGSKNYFWRGGTTPQTKKRLLSCEWDSVRKKVYQRDNYVCQHCGRSKLRLSAHHIKPYEISKDDSLENLITLCDSCHAKEEIRIQGYWNRKTCSRHARCKEQEGK